MPGFAGDQLVATSRGLVPMASVPGVEVLRKPDLLELQFSDGGILRCAQDQPLLCSDDRLVLAGELGPGDRVVRKGQYVPRTDALPALPEAAVVVAQESGLQLPCEWSEELAHYLGWLIGDGSFSDRGAVTIYGSELEIRELLPVHRDLLTSWSGFEPKPSVQPNGTQQLRLMRKAFVDYLSALGVAKAKSADKRVPNSVLQAPEKCLAAFLRGLFDADGCVVNNLKKGTRYVGLGSRSPELLRTVQSLLLSLGLRGRIYCTTKTGKPSFSYTRRDGSHVSYRSAGPSFDLRITSGPLHRFPSAVGFTLGRKREALRKLVTDHSFYRCRGEVRMVASRPRSPEQWSVDGFLV